MFSLELAWTPVVVLNGLEAVREALVHRSEDTADRPPMPVYDHLGFGPESQGKRGRGAARGLAGMGQQRQAPRGHAGQDGGARQGRGSNLGGADEGGPRALGSGRGRRGGRE